MTVRVRIAPSPTGNLHIGTARTAVFNWLFARNQGGTFVLRVEDTDLERSRPEYTENIREGLTWLGLTWDEGPFFQTERMDLYRQAIQTLLDNGAAYHCFCTEEELEAMRAAQEANGQAPRYDNRHRHLTPEQQQEFVAEGRQPVIRFKIEDDREIIWEDLVRDRVSWKGTDLGGDMVIARRAPWGEIGNPLYNFVVVVDDVDMKITHVIRGEDHVANTAKQILLYEALGATVPIFAHTPLILSPSGKKLSKRDGVTSIWDFRQMGYLPEAMVNYMSLLGWSPPDAQERFTLAEAAPKFGFDRVNKAGAKFDWDKLNWLNSQYIHDMPIDQLTPLLIPYWQAAGYEFDAGDRAWLEQLTALVAPSLVRLEDAVAMAKYLFVPPLEYSEEANAQLGQEGVAAVMQALVDAVDGEATLDEAGAQAVIQQVVKGAGVKKGVVMRSLRAALTGEMHGPDLIQSWLLLHQHQLDVTRLQGAIKH
jgi:glutamyl-tRNA synthetase